MTMTAKSLHIILLTVGMLTTASAVFAAPKADIPRCEAIAERAGQAAGVPETRLAAISRVEAGIARAGEPFRAWPWTLNQGGKSMYFDTKAEALDYLRNAIANGVRNIDVGCMQINYRWHASNFKSLDQMMDPAANAAYAAEFLSTLRARHGSWDAATQNYHSSEDARGKAYLKKVRAAEGDLPDLSGNAVLMAAVDTGGSNGKQRTIERNADGGLRPMGPLVAVAASDGTYGDALARIKQNVPTLAPAQLSDTDRTARDEAPRLVARQWDRIAALRDGFARQAGGN